MIGILLSIVFPGLGQIYYGKKFRGFIMILLAITPLYPVILFWSVWDCIKLRNSVEVDPIKKKEAISAIILFLIVIPLFSLAIFYGSYWALISFSNNCIKPWKTKKEMLEISRTMDDCFRINKIYPASLNHLIRNRPLRESWLDDEWGNDYRFLLHDRESYSLVSAGKDSQFNTVDDLKISGQKGISKAGFK